MMDVCKIKKSYGKKTVLLEASFSAQEGSCTGIIGKNGCGKSTLLSILAGVQKASGSFIYKGCDLLKDKRLRQKLIGYVPQGMPLFADLTGLDNLMLWYRCGREELIKKVNTGLLANLNIGDLLNISVGKMSGGMKKKLSIACAVANDPKILLLDEPSNSLDIVARMQIKSYLQEFQNSGGTIVIVTHNEDEILLCSKCFLLSGGMLLPYEYNGDIKSLAADLLNSK